MPRDPPAGLKTMLEVRRWRRVIIMKRGRTGRQTTARTTHGFDTNRRVEEVFLDVARGRVQESAPAPARPAPRDLAA